MLSKSEIIQMVNNAKDTNNPSIALKISELEPPVAEWLKENYLVEERVTIAPVYIVSGW